MLQIRATQSYRKSLKKLIASVNFKLQELESTIDLIVSGQRLPVKNKDHALSGELAGFRECHVRPDVLLVYYIDGGECVLVLVNIGSHSDLF